MLLFDRTLDETLESASSDTSSTSGGSRISTAVDRRHRQSDKIAGQPVRVIDPLSGRPFLRFDGLDDVLVTRRRMAVQTVFAVAREAARHQVATLWWATLNSATSTAAATAGLLSQGPLRRGGHRGAIGRTADRPDRDAPAGEAVSTHIATPMPLS